MVVVVVVCNEQRKRSVELLFSKEEKVIGFILHSQLSNFFFSMSQLLWASAGSVVVSRPLIIQSERELWICTELVSKSL